MSLTESIVFILRDNPVSQGTLSLAKSVISTATGWIPLTPKPQQTASIMAPPPMVIPHLFKLAGTSSLFLRLGGLSGALAVGLGAYGAHTIMNNEEGNEHRKKVFDTANKYHFYHSLALLAVPLAHYPAITGLLLSAGMLAFCGPCYYMSITGKDNLRRFTPIGGVFLILAWVSFIL